MAFDVPVHEVVCKEAVGGYEAGKSYKVIVTNIFTGKVSISLSGFTGPDPMYKTFDNREELDRYFRFE